MQVDEPPVPHREFGNDCVDPAEVGPRNASIDTEEVPRIVAERRIVDIADEDGSKG